NPVLLSVRILIPRDSHGRRRLRGRRDSRHFGGGQLQLRRRILPTGERLTVSVQGRDPYVIRFALLQPRQLMRRFLQVLRLNHLTVGSALRRDLLTRRIEDSILLGGRHLVPRHLRRRRLDVRQRNVLDRSARLDRRLLPARDGLAVAVDGRNLHVIGLAGLDLIAVGKLRERVRRLLEVLGLNDRTVRLTRPRHVLLGSSVNAVLLGLGICRPLDGNLIARWPALTLQTVDGALVVQKLFDLSAQAILRGQPVIYLRTRTCGADNIAVARYTAQTLAAHGHFALGRQVVLVETPRDELRQGILHGLRRIGTGERAHQRDAHGIAVDLIVTGVSPAHVLFDDSAGLLDAACASFKNLTVLVDEKVVADIAPATA